MKNFTDFLSAALPWLCMGLMLAIFFAKSASRKPSETKEKKSKEAKEDYGTVGMSIGMCFGVALESSLGITRGLGMLAGMLLGLAVGSSMEKKEDDK